MKPTVMQAKPSVSSPILILVILLVLSLAAMPIGAQPLLGLVSPNEEQGGHFGFSVSGVSDVNGDGFGDLVVGAPFEDPGASPRSAGRVYVFDGATGNLLHTLISPNEEKWGNFGHSVSGVSDVSGDGFGDVIVGAAYDSPGPGLEYAGRAYIFDGTTGKLLEALSSPNEEKRGHFGCSVSGVSDVNGDSFDDVVVGAFGEGPGCPPEGGVGRAYIFSGATGSILHTLTSPNEETGGWFGLSVSSVADVNGDGFGDVIVGASMEDSGSSATDTGRVYILDGATGSLLYTLNSPNEEQSGHFGTSVSGVPDMNGDGRGDVVVGACHEDPGPCPDDSGGAYVFDGATGALLWARVSPNQRKGGNFGRCVAGVPDLNGDGRGDVVVGAQHECSDSNAGYVGYVYIFDGATGNLLRTLAPPDEQRIRRWGLSVSGVADVNGDGFGDLLVGAYSESPGSSPSDAGRAYVFLGPGPPTDTPTRTPTETPSHTPTNTPTVTSTDTPTYTPTLQNGLKVGNGSAAAATTGNVSVYLENRKEIWGLQFTIKDLPPELCGVDVAPVGRAANFTARANDLGADGYRVLVYNMHDDVVIAAGRGEILNLTYSVNWEAPATVVALELTDVIAAGTNSARISMAAVDGQFTITGETPTATTTPTPNEPPTARQTVHGRKLPSGPSVRWSNCHKGDLDFDGTREFSDVLRIAEIILEQGPAPVFYELWSAKVNRDDDIDITDFVFDVAHIRWFDKGKRR